MIRFKDFSDGLNFRELENYSVKLLSGKQTLFLRIDSKDKVVDASYTGAKNPWIASICTLIKEKSVHDISTLGWRDLDLLFQADQTYWDLKSDQENSFFTPFEIFRAAIDVFRGSDHIYKEPDLLICRCFGVREKDVREFIQKTDDPTPEGLATASKAGMGCRSCVPQLTKWLSVNMPKSSHYFKERPKTYWLLEIDKALTDFPEAREWQMEIQSFKDGQVVIEYQKEVNQKSEEEVARRLQDFLAGAVDSDLSFFLIRSRQR